VEDSLKYLSVYLASTVKFIGGPVAGISLGLTYLETVVFTVAGMMTSVVLFTYVGRAFGIWYSDYQRSKKKRVFTRRNRMIVKVWGTFGVIGIAFLTPLLFTPVFGPIIAAMLGGSKKIIILHMFWSAMLWGFVLTYIAFEFREFALEWF
jgi:hypothetical protein